MDNWRNRFTMSEVKDFRDSEAEVYRSAHHGIEDTHFQRFREGLKYLDIRPGMKVLNILAIIGEAIPYMRRKCLEIEIVNAELSAKFIAIGKEEHPGECFIQTSVVDLPFRDCYFDYVLSLETLEHVPDPVGFLQELYRTLKWGGTLVMSLPPKTAELPLRVYEMLFPHHGEGPHQFLPSKVVKRMTREVGFTLLMHKGTLLVPVGPRWLKALGERLIDRLQRTPLSELGIRQFYVCRKEQRG
jgi:ubiquinone/menaquinone biosynthesis C-methylase UbiE